MDTMAAVIAIAGALGGGAGLAAVLTVLFQYRKYKAEAQTIRVQNEQNEMEYVKNALKDIVSETKKQMEELRATNKAQMDELREANHNLEERVTTLNNKIQKLVNWIFVDDHRYRSWLESKLHEYDPGLVLPELPNPPDVFGDFERHSSTSAGHKESY